jgi:hypothetical protein
MPDFNPNDAFKPIESFKDLTVAQKNDMVILSGVAVIELSEEEKSLFSEEENDLYVRVSIKPEKERSIDKFTSKFLTPDEIPDEVHFIYVKKNGSVLEETVLESNQNNLKITNLMFDKDEVFKRLKYDEERTANLGNVSFQNWENDQVGFPPLCVSPTSTTSPFKSGGISKYIG